MKISFYTNLQKKEFYNFNSRSFPERGLFNQKLINFRYFNTLNSGNFIDNNIIALDDKNQICGQVLYHPANYFFGNKLHNMEWSFDLYVDPDKRSDSVGLQLFEFAKANKVGSIFATGVGEKALRIEKFFGFNVIGYLKKYYKIVNPVYLLSGLLRAKNIKTSKFPSQVIIENKIFKKIDLKYLWNEEYPYNKELLEFERSIDFMRWRFYSEEFNYSVYQNIDQPKTVKPTYFVVRTVKIKRITSLVIVDYRYDTSLAEDFGLLLKAAQKIASILLLPIVVTGSSLQISDRILDLLKFKVTGKDRPIICNIRDYKQSKEEIINRNFIFTTLADSDGEYLM